MLKRFLMLSFLLLAGVISALGQTYPTTIDTEYTMPQFADNKSTYLTAAVSSAAATFPVASTAGFPFSGVIQIGNEWINYVVLDGTHFSVWLSRPYGGTVASAHPIRSPVRIVYTALNHNSLRTGILAIEAKLGIGITPPIFAGYHLRVTSSGLTDWAQIPVADLGSGTPGATNFLRGNRSWSSLAATDILTGTMDSARLGTGTPNSTKFLRGDATWQAFTSGTVTSVGLSLPSEITVSGSPVTTSGTLTGVWADQTINKVFASPNIATGPPIFRSLVAEDIPNLATTKITSGTMAIARLGTGTADATKFLRGDSTWQTFTTGTVTSVGLSGPAEFSVTGSPVSTSGTLNLAWATQLMNLVFAGPTSGIGSTPTFRALVTNDIPALNASKITAGTMATARLGSGTADGTTFLRGDSTWQTFTTGTVTSVALSLPSIFSVSGSPVTTTGTLTGSLATQTANIVFAGPSSGGAVAPTFRALVINDLPGSIPNSKLASSSITVTGTANQVNVSGSPVSLGGTVTLSTPQDIHSGASPTFSALTLTNGSKQGGRGLIGSSSASYATVGLEIRYGTSSDNDRAIRLANASGANWYDIGRENTATGYLVFDGNGGSPAEVYEFRNAPISFNTGVTFANLYGPAGAIIYCSNCTIANPCAAGGTGAIAKQLNGIWVCN